MPETTEIAKDTLKSVNQNGIAKKVAVPKIEQIRSDEVQEIISAVPSWMIRWGITLIFGLIVMLIALSWFIKYPDIIVGNATLTTLEPPVKLVVKSSGKLTSILLTDGSMVEKNQIIAEMENPVTQDGISFLKKYVFEIRNYLKSSNNELPLVNENYVFGTMQTTFNELQKNLKNLQELKQNNFSIQKINSLKSKIVQYKKLIAISSKQLILLKDELKNAEEKYKADQQLYEKGYTAKMEFYKEETLLRQKQMDLENLNKVETEQQITLINLQQELNDAEFQYQENERTLTNNIQANLLEIENGIENWQQNYSFVSPVSGKLVWLEKIHQNQFIESGKSLFAITTNNEKFIALATIPATGFGKIQAGQKARIKLSNYPSYEFGHLEGLVSKLTEIPNENSYQVEITLNNGMTSSYNKLLTFTPEMTGSAEIVTDDLRVMQRIFNQFNKLFDRNTNANASVSSTLSK
ncbi:MAG: HlyD family efflux transporter periplasmic adaptor subunit [Bacteroidetes bacterium]|nr:HlyD family efflux transporter periplasmic adaptor subunit [Bacteroidota bacterium]NOG96207.1 HlyD family efflux transporter periplasmic adaptor subunit [Bacteroidota bacterium]